MQMRPTSETFREGLPSFTGFSWDVVKRQKKTERTNWKPSKRFLTSSTTGQRWRHEQRDRLFVVGFLVSDWIESRPMATRVRAPSFTVFFED